MPKPVAAVDSLRNLMSIVKDVDFDEIRIRASQAPRILTIAPNEPDAWASAERVFGPRIERFVEYRSAMDLAGLDPGGYDVILTPDQATRDAFERFRRSGIVVPSAHVVADVGDPSISDHRLRLQIASANPDLAPALGRWFAPFRGVASRVVIDETSKANARFAAISNLSAAIPVLGGMVAASADLVVLTKNQVMMAYKLAAMNDRDLSDHPGVIRELAPVVGAGFVWRSVAREATSFVPFAGGTIPKAVIAFTGTYSTGLAVEYFYRYGRKSSREQMKMFREQALTLFSMVSIPRRGQDRRASAAILATGERIASLDATVRQSPDEEPGTE